MATTTIKAPRQKIKVYDYSLESNQMFAKGTVIRGYASIPFSITFDAWDVIEAANALKIIKDFSDYDTGRSGQQMRIGMFVSHPALNSDGQNDKFAYYGYEELYKEFSGADQESIVDYIVSHRSEIQLTQSK